MAHLSVQKMHQQEHEASRLKAAVLDLAKKIVGLKELPQELPGSLDVACVALINDVHVLARRHRVTLSVSVSGAKDVNIEKNAHPSMISGLREVRFHVAFSGLPRRGTLLSLLDALAALEGRASVLLQNVTYEKDILALDLIVIGP